MFNMIITSIFGGTAVGCLCWSADSSNLPVGIISGLCSAICIFSYMYYSSSKTKTQITERNELIKQLSDDNEKIISLIELNNNTNSKCLRNISDNLIKQASTSNTLNTINNVLLKSIEKDFKNNLVRQTAIIKACSSISQSINECKNNTKSMSECSNQLKEILAPKEKENNVLIDIKGTLNEIKISSDSADNTLSNNNTLLSSIQGLIYDGKEDYSKIADAINKNNDKLKKVCKSVEQFDEEYKKLLDKLTSEQNRMLAVQRENCELLRVVGDKFRGENNK